MGGNRTTIQGLSRGTGIAVILCALSFFFLATAQNAQAQIEAGIAASVNGKPISFFDLENRTKLAVFSAGLPPNDDVVQRLMPQVLNTMIDEELERQEAEAQNIKIREREEQDVRANMERANGLPPGGLDEFLKSRGLDKNALNSQIRASILWRKLVQRRLASQVEVGDDEVEDELRRLVENRGKPQFLVSEIFLGVDSTSVDTQVRQAADRILQQLRAGADFGALARAFSQNSTAAAGGDLGWIVQGQLPEELDRVLATMQAGQVTVPLRTIDGYHILLLRDRKLPGGGTPDKITVDLAQITIPLSPAASQEELNAVQQTIQQIRGAVADCNALEARQLPGGATRIRIGRIKISDLAPTLQGSIIGLDSNQMSMPLQSDAGVVMFMVCAREVEELEAPDREAIRERLSAEKLNLLARRYLRDLRRAADLDVRI